MSADPDHYPLSVPGDTAGTRELHPAVNPDDFLGYTIVRLGHVLERRFEAILAAHGMTPRQFGVLAQLDRDPGLGSGELARLVLITPQSMGALLDELQREGMLTRTPASRGRRRETRLTNEGLARMARAAPAVAAFERATTAALDSDTLAQLNRALHLVLRSTLSAE